MTNLELVFPEIFLSLSIMFLLILGVFKNNSSKLIQNISLIVLLVVAVITFNETLGKDEFFLLTTNTLSAAKLIKDKIKKGLPAIHQYHPYDHPKFVSKFLNHWKPNMAVFLESDFWPNLIYLTSLRAR